MVEVAVRRLVLLAGDRELAVDGLLSGLSPADLAQTLWIANTSAPSAVVQVTAAKVLQHLGRDYRLVVFDAHQGFHPDAFAAAVGTLCGGGDCVLLIPSLDDWQRFVDPDRARFAAYPQTLEDIPGHFIQRLSNLWRADPAVQVVDPQDGFVPRLAVSISEDLVLTEAQCTAIDAVRRVARGHARRPLVLTADRGRGKSTVLGVAAARLLLDGYPRITVVAPQRQAVETLFRHARGTAGLDDDVVDIRIGQGSLHFRLPQECLDNDEDLGLLLIDEAAALPVAVLADLLALNNRLVFASTVHGYEGSGRGFALRFAELLQGTMPQWRALQLDRPVRWSPADPLEGLLNRSLLLDADDDVAPTDGALRIDTVDGASLAEDEPLLRAVFGLLVSAHYQTRPSDLRQLLDDPQLSIWLARQGETVVGVLIAVREGGLDEPMIDRILAGRRRPRGHMLVQSLAVHAGLEAVLRQRVWRIQRVAVHADCRRRGIARRLIEALANAAQDQETDLLGCAYGADRSLLAFWSALGFRPQRLGLRVDPASAAHSLFMLRGLSPRGNELAGQGWSCFMDQLPWALGGSLRHLDPSLAMDLLSGRDCRDISLDTPARRALGVVASGARSPATAEALVWKALVVLASKTPRRKGLAPVFAWQIQRRSEAHVRRRFGLSGRGELEARLRVLLEYLPPDSQDG